MFTGLTAWFSSSIGLRKKQKWLDNGGTEAVLDDAEYIFSADAGCEDTERIFSSEPYVDEHLAVFHPNYVDECLKQGGPKAGLLGKYFLPPKDVQKLIREQMSLQWDVDGHTSDSDSPKAGDSSQALKQPGQPKPGPSAENAKKSLNRQPNNHTVAKAGSSKEPSSEPKNNRTTGQNQNKPERVQKSEVLEQEEQEYLRLEDLAKSTGELMDFVPGRDGCDMVIK